ncbi:MFS transporter [Pseudomonas sp. ISL-84]|nr:MFS transporter [Pseudomonas sp. ISL-84]
MVTFAILYCPQPLISVFSEQYQVSPSNASFTISFTTAALALSMLIIPIVGNRWGRKRVMSFSLFSTSLLTMLSPLGDSFELLLATRMLIGFSLSGFLASAVVYLNEEFSPRSIGGVVGIYIGGTAVGGVLGRVWVGVLTDYFSWGVALFTLGLISFLCSIWFGIFLPKPANLKRATLSFTNWKSNIKKSLRSKKLLNLYGVGFILIGVYVTMLNYICYPLTEEPYSLSQSILGFLFLVTLGGTYSSVVFGKLMDRYPQTQVIAWAMALAGLGALLTLNDYLFIKVLGIAVFAFGFFAGHTVASGWVAAEAPSHTRAQAASMYLLFYYTGSSIIGWLGGFFWSYYGWIGVIGMICALLGIAYFLTLSLKHGNSAAVEGYRVKRYS